MSTSFRLDVHIAAPPAAVFAAQTEPATLQAWLAEHADVALADGRYAFWGRDVPMTREPGHQRLIDVEEARRLHFAWEQDGTDTEVEFVLEADGDGTALTLTQSESPDWAGDIAGVRDFWYRAMLALTEHLEGRPPVPRYDFSTTHGDAARVEIDIDAPVDRVFASLIEPDQVERCSCRGPRSSRASAAASTWAGTTGRSRSWRSTRRTSSPTGGATGASRTRWCVGSSKAPRVAPT
jgi:uncharacterized protein YndB with AHSA1/START domain